MNILHITPHLGGGLGRVLINWVRKENELKNNVHILACLEKTNNATENFEDVKINFHDNLHNDKDLLKQLINDSDIVVVNWYNHPLLFDLFMNFDFPKCRLVCYNHVSSLNPPYNMSEKLIRFFDKIVFTTNASYEAKEIVDLSDDLKEKLCTIESAFGSEKYYEIKDPLKKDYEMFNVGYIGTASYSKLDSNFVHLCTNVKSPAKFIVCSGDSQDHIKQDAERLGVANIFDFKGRVDDVTPYLKLSNIFGYPLQPKHLGSAEQVFGEMMMFGAVPVAMNNPAERYIIENNKNGILANNYTEYSNAIDYLFNNRLVLKKMAYRAREFAKERYSVMRKINLWNSVFQETLKINKKNKFWEKAKTKQEKPEGNLLFIESIGGCGEIFKEYIANDCPEEINTLNDKIKVLFNSNLQWKSENKGGPKQYLRYFPDDKYLKKWSQLC